MIEKNYESVQHRKFKYRVVFQGNQVIDQNWETALFQDLGSSRASMEASKVADLHGCLPGHEIEQADAEQAYIQAELSGKETWILLPEEAWPDSWYECRKGVPDKSKPIYYKPVIRLYKALYGHPDSGTRWE